MSDFETRCRRMVDMRWYPVRITWADGARYEDEIYAGNPGDAIQRAFMNWGAGPWHVVSVEVVEATPR